MPGSVKFAEKRIEKLLDQAKTEAIGRGEPEQVVVPKEPPFEEQVATRAHALWKASGGVAGRELDDWLQAERELKTAQPSEKPE